MTERSPSSWCCNTCRKLASVRAEDSDGTVRAVNVRPLGFQRLSRFCSLGYRLSESLEEGVVVVASLLLLRPLLSDLVS